MDNARLRELGVQLRQQRERLGLDLDQVEAETKIRKRYLKAIEDGDWSVLPGEVYARGFVRTYAQYMGLDGQALLAEYAAEPAPAAAERTRNVRGTTAAANADRGFAASEPPERDGARVPPAARAVRHSTAANRQTRRSVRPLAQRRQRGWAGQAFVVAGMLVVLAGGVWYLNRHEASGRTAHVQNPVRPSNITAVKGGVPGNQPGTLGTSGQRTHAHPSGQVGGGQGKPALPAKPVIVAEPFDAHQAVQTYLVTTAKPLTVTMSVTSPCWVSVTADGQTVDGNDTVQPGAPKSWQGVSSVKVRLGHVQGVTLTVNGQPVTLPSTGLAIDVVFNKVASTSGSGTSPASGTGPAAAAPPAGQTPATGAGSSTLQ